MWSKYIRKLSAFDFRIISSNQTWPTYREHGEFASSRKSPLSVYRYYQCSVVFEVIINLIK